MEVLHDIVAAKALDDTHLDVRFDNGKHGIFDQLFCSLGCDNGRRMVE